MATIVIIGAGPAGLAAAAELLRTTSHKIILMEKRKLSLENFIRSRRIATYGETYEILSRDKEKISDKKHEKLLQEVDPDKDKSFYKWDTHRTAKLKDIERALFRRLELYADRLTIYDQAELTDVDRDESTLYFNKDSIKQKIDFNYLFIADGSKRETLNKMLEKEKSDSSFRFVPTNTGFDYKYHASVYLQLPEKISLTKLSKQPIGAVEQTPHLLDHLEKFKQLGWTEKYPPISFCLSDRSLKKVNVTLEIPESIYNESNIVLRKQKLIQWARLLVELQMGIDSKIIEQLDVKTFSKHSGKAKLRYSFFNPPANLDKIDPFFIKTKKGGMGVLGEAAMSSFYPTAMGTNLALQLADKLASCFEGDNFNAEKFSQAAANCADQIEKSCREEMEIRTKIRAKM